MVDILQVYQNATIIDGKTVGNTVLDLGPGFTSAIPLLVVIGTSASTSAVTTPPTVSVGVTNPNYVDFLAAFVLPASMNNAGRYATYLPIAGNLSTSSPGSIFCRVSVAAIATSYHFFVAVLAADLGQSGSPYA